MGEAVEKNWEDNENVAIIDFLDDVGQPYSCFQWGIFDDDDLPTIINDGNYNFHDQFHDVYPANVFIDHEMKVHAILDTMYNSETEFDSAVESVNDKIQEMLNSAGLAVENQYDSHIPNHYKIINIYPNPFNPVLNINFDIALAGAVQIDILDITGTHIETLHVGLLYSGNHEISWNAESMPSGVYLVSLKNGEKSLTEKVVLLK